MLRARVKLQLTISNKLLSVSLCPEQKQSINEQFMPLTLAKNIIYHIELNKS